MRSTGADETHHERACLSAGKLACRAAQRRQRRTGRSDLGVALHEPAVGAGQAREAPCLCTRRRHRPLNDELQCTVRGPTDTPTWERRCPRNPSICRTNSHLAKSFAPAEDLQLLCQVGASGGECTWQSSIFASTNWPSGPDAPGTPPCHGEAVAGRPGLARPQAPCPQRSRGRRSRPGP